MGWLILITVSVAIALAARNPQGTRVLGSFWVVLSAPRIGLWLWMTAGHYNFTADERIEIARSRQRLH